MKEDKILERELGKLGAFGGALGGSAPGAAGGRIGARCASRFLPTETFREVMQVGVGAEEALQTVFAILQRVGRFTDEFTTDSEIPQLSAIVGSGFLSMNPTILHVTVSPLAGGGSSVMITGAAKEGMIKQHSAQRAVLHIKEIFLKESAPFNRGANEGG